MSTQAKTPMQGPASTKQNTTPKKPATPKPGSITKVRGAQYQFPSHLLVQSKPEKPTQQQSKPKESVLETASNTYKVDEHKLQAQISEINEQLKVKKSPSIGNGLSSLLTGTAQNSSNQNGSTTELKRKTSNTTITSVVSALPSFPQLPSLPSFTRARSKSNGSPTPAQQPTQAKAPLESLKPVTNNMGEADKQFVTRNSNHTLQIDDDFNISSSKLEKFIKFVNNSDELDLDELRKISWSGIPSQVRAQVWKILVGYLPATETNRDEIEQQKRKEYLGFVDKFYNETAMKKTDNEHAIQRQIHIDVPRTNPDVFLFQDKKIQIALERILYIWSIRHPASGYVQGINDLVTPFITVFLYDYLKTDVLNLSMETVPDDVLERVECDSFWCFSHFLDFIQDHYTFAQPGIHRMVDKLEELIQKIDAPLYKHIQEQSLQFIQFAYRWMNCLLMRELSLKLIIRMFDAYLAEGDSFETLHIYVCAAFLKTWSEKLRTLDFSEMVMFIQHLPTYEWKYAEIELLLSQAFYLRELYKPSSKHLA